MSFMNPWLLVGMLAGLIPIIIHLINRQRARLRRFAALEFLLLSDKRQARRLRIRQLLVLLLRVGLLMAIPFALAKPYVQPDSQDTSANVRAPGAVVLVLDDSMSMQARRADGTPLLEAALARALDAPAADGA